MNVNQIKKICNFAARKQWGFSSSGRALGSQSKGGRFESGILHWEVGSVCGSLKRVIALYGRLFLFYLDFVDTVLNVFIIGFNSYRQFSLEIQIIVLSIDEIIIKNSHILIAIV